MNMGKQRAMCGVAVIAAVAALGLSPTPSHADWNDTFDGGLDQSWTFGDEAGNGILAPAGGTSGTSGAAATFSYSTSGNFLTLADTDADSGNGPAFVAGFVSESFNDVLVSGTVNPGGATMNSSLGLLARFAPGSANAYAVYIDPTAETGDAGPEFELGKFTGGAGNQLQALVIPNYIATNSYFLELSVTGGSNTSLIARLWDSAAKNDLIVDLDYLDTATDDDNGNPGDGDTGLAFTSGVSGVFATVNTTALNASWDNVTSTVPEPASIALLMGGGLLLTMRRRTK